jgi:isoleucyl-tRNA synthetase
LLDKKADKLKSYEEKIVKERTELQRVLNRSKEFDIERLNTLYEVHIQNESEKLEKTLETSKREIEEFYDREVKEIQELFKEQQSRKLSELQADIRDTQVMIDKILPRDDPHLLSLLILSDILQGICFNFCY